jgi:hypothetical protein
LDIMYVERIVAKLRLRMPIKNHRKKALVALSVRSVRAKGLGSKKNAKDRKIK